jgi:polyisoprenoid-binding protein YceI
MRSFLFFPLSLLFTSCGGAAPDPKEDPPDPSEDSPTDSSAGGDDSSSGGDSEDSAPGSSAKAYRFNQNNSLLFVQVFKDPDAWGSSFAHDHVIRAGDWLGELSWDAADPASCSVSVTVQVAGLAVDEDDMRQKVGYGDKLSSGDRDDIRESMLSEGQLNGDSYDTIRFTGADCALAGTTLTVSGEMTLRGRAKRVELPLSVTLTDDRFSATAQLTLRTTDYGFEPYEAFGGAVRNEEAMTLSMELSAKAQ